jgi:hypothetical protein
MVENQSDFPFCKLRQDKFLTLEVMMFVEHLDVYKFMFTINKKSRSYLHDNFIIIQNGFINGGLITHLLKSNFYHID